MVRVMEVIESNGVIVREWMNLIRNWEADRARDKSIASERSVGGIANRVNGHGTATSLL